MSLHLHLLHLPAPLARVVHRCHHSTPASTDPAAVERWAEWVTPDQWLAEHGHHTETNSSPAERAQP